MNKTSGIPKIKVGLIDGPVDMTHSTLNRHMIRIIKQTDQIDNNNSPAITHGTFVAGILCARRDTSSQAPAICPNCTIIIRPIFNNSPKNNIVPSCDPKELSEAIVETVDEGANIINLSVGISNSSFFHIKEIQEAYDYALKNDTIPIVAAGNQANVGQVSIIDHPWVIPVSACDTTGRISSISNFGPSIGKRGIMAPGVGIKSILPKEKYGYMSGTSFAAPFVTGTIALLWSLFPKISSTHILRAVLNMSVRRHAIIPPILNAELALKTLETLITYPANE
jgi:subtilisin family serine protease